MNCKNIYINQTCVERKLEKYDTCVNCYFLNEEEQDPSFYPKLFYAEDLLELKYKKERKQ